MSPSQRNIAGLIAGTLAVVSMSSALAAPSARTRCDMVKTFACSVKECFDVTTKAWAIIDWGAADYDLCDGQGCERVKFTAWQDGLYISMTFPNKDMMAKVNLTDQTIVETSTILNNSITSFGKCFKGPVDAK